MSSTPTLTGTAKGLSQNGLIAVQWVGAATAGCFLSLRCYARWREAGRLFWDDYWMLAAYVILIANAVLQTLQAPSLYYMVYLLNGLVPVDEKTPILGLEYAKYEFVIIGLFWTVLWCVKGSFLALYYRLLEGQRVYRRIWYGCVVFIILAYIGCWIASIWTCHPPSTYFEFGQCSKPIDREGAFIAISYSTAVDILSDLMIMTLPLRILKDLQVSSKQKAGLFVVFGLGLIIIACAVIRMTQLLAYVEADPPGLAVWGTVESTVSVIVGSLPPLKSFLSKKFKQYTTHRRNYYGNQEGYAGGTRGGKSAQLSSTMSKSGAKAEHIPLDDREGSGSSVVALKGQIVVQKDFGWVRGGTSLSDGDATSITHRADDEEARIVGVAVSDNVPVHGKTWLKT